MILHLGRDFFVKKKDILMILEYQEAMKNQDTKNFLKNLEKIDLGEGQPKAIIVAQEYGKEVAYLSQISSRTLLKRSEQKTVL